MQIRRTAIAWTGDCLPSLVIPAIGTNGCGEPVARVDKNGFVRGEARQQLIGSLTRSDAMGRSKAPAVLLHLIGAEKLRTQRQLVAAGRGSAGPRRREILERLTDDGIVVDFQL